MFKVNIFTQSTFDDDYFYSVSAESENGKIKYSSDSEGLYFGSHKLAYLAAADHVNAWIAQGKL